MTDLAELQRGRECYARRAWLNAYESLSAADHKRPLDAEDLWRLAMAALLIGREEDFLAFLDRAHRGHLEAGETARAARCAFWMGFRLASRGDIGQASGWFARARRLLEREPGECAEHGYLLLPLVLQHLGGGEHKEAHATAVKAGRIGERFAEPDLHTLAMHLQGRALLELSRLDDGLALLDESMVAVASGELSPPVAGLIYCSMIGTCRKVYALRRAHEWTVALKRWCDEQPDMVSYTGQCLVYRAEIMKLQGAWREAIEEARRACEYGTRAADHPAMSSALYEEGEVYRLLGEFDAAEEAFRKASRLGREPQPGLALLRLAQGNVEAAVAGMRRVLSETKDRLQRARLLAAYVDIAAEAGQLEEARCACRELEEIAAECDTSVLCTIVANARGTVYLLAGDTAAALVSLRKAWQGWDEIDAPYEAARSRALLARACRSLGDDDAARLELDAAREVFERLGAAPDLARLHLVTPPGPAATLPRRLTRRELEVLILLATGKTNRAIADQLFISQKTVDRHVSNIFQKMNVSTRAAATAYAYEHGLV